VSRFPHFPRRRGPNQQKENTVAVTTLDPKTALVVIDLQKGILSYPTVHPVAEVVNHAGALADAFRRHDLPIVLVVAAGRAPGRTEQARSHAELPAGFTDLLPELNRQPQDHTVTKLTPGAFTNTDLEVHLKTMGVTQVVIAGVATSNGVEATARHAYELGFNVTLAIDGMTDLSAEVHVNSITRIFPRLGETGTTKEIIDLLKGTRA
jgi:nicotinamidase-related amidase